MASDLLKIGNKKSNTWSIKKVSDSQLKAWENSLENLMEKISDNGDLRGKIKIIMIKSPKPLELNLKLIGMKRGRNLLITSSN
jgi:hypothetical protein